MKGITTDCKKGKVKKIDDGLPMPAYTPCPPSEGLDLNLAKEKLGEIDELRARIEALEKK